MHSPHDRLFAFTFRQACHAASWLRAVLPAELVDAVDWQALAPLRERFPGARLRPHVPDAGFATSVTLDGTARDVVLLIEHKSFDDGDVEQQLLRYSIHVQRALQRELGRAPFVVAALLRHNHRPHVPEAAAPQSPHELLLQTSPHQRVFVDDLDAVTENDIAARGMTPLAELTLRCLKVLPRAVPAEVVRAFDRWQHLLRAVDRVAAPPHAPPLGADAVDAFGWYALGTTEAESLALSETFCRILQRDDDTIMSTLDRTFQKGVSRGLSQGISQGISQGQSEGSANTLLRILTRRFGPLDEATEQRVRRATQPQLDVWIDRVLDARSLDELLA